ncbi:MAG: methyl-accepting chemotaxis protein [Lachnospiraceae bacterium]|nr:methyl-accepting chemotaxis protein [Lachnospiraceae bacterium]
MNKKRSSLKKIILLRVLVAVTIIIIIITGYNMSTQSDQIKTLSVSLLARDSVTYAEEIGNWWKLIESRVEMSAEIWRSSPNMSFEQTRELLEGLTVSDPDSQDIYMANGSSGRFFDGSGWVPDDNFVFTDRPWYKGAISAGGQIYSSDPYVDASTGKTCIACSIMVRDDVVLSSDINFDKMQEKLDAFESSSDEVKIYIINAATGDILLSNDPSVVGSTLSSSTDTTVKGLASVYSSLNTSSTASGDRVSITGTGAGKMMYVATEIDGTSWLVASATPYSFVMDPTLSSLNVSLIITLISLGLLAAFLYFIIRKYLNPVSNVTGKIGDLTGGDFTTDIVPEGNNEITTLSEQLNDYIDRMKGMLTHLTEITGDMNESAEQCAGISGGLRESNASQNESIEKLNDYLNGLDQSIDDVANAATELANVSSNLATNSEEVRTLCEETVKASESGRGEMRDMTQAVKVLNDTIEELTSIIRMTAETVDEIKGITNTIGDISSQTNLLSLNASIEAARAGEAGRGFAVVASEVGALANQSSTAAAHISTLVETITENIANINEKADDCIKDMEKCLAGVSRSNESFESIYTDITKATDAITDIVSGIGKINDVASNNAAATEEQAATVTQILELSDIIVKDSGKLSNDTESLSEVSEKLSDCSAAISDDLKNFKLN